MSQFLKIILKTLNATGCYQSNVIIDFIICNTQNLIFVEHPPENLGAMLPHIIQLGLRAPIDLLVPITLNCIIFSLRL